VTGQGLQCQELGFFAELSIHSLWKTLGEERRFAGERTEFFCPYLTHPDFGGYVKAQPDMGV
jgi:hypothetical protein